MSEVTINVRESGSGYFDVRDIIERFEELEAIKEAAEDEETQGDPLDEEDAAEYAALESLLGDLCGNGGDEQWRGEWYPITLIPESGFEDYARELAEDCGLIPDDAQWPCNCIDWEQAAGELRMDYSEVDFNGETYLYR